MSNSYNLELPLLMAQQAQKHVTMNEALLRLDALTQMRFVSRNATVPPSAPVEGMAYALPQSGLSGAWLGQEGKIALAGNGDWVYLTPKQGWIAYVEDEATRIEMTPTGWQSFGSSAPNAPAIALKTLSTLHQITAGSTNDTSLLIPSHTMMIGVSARITEAFTLTTATSWEIGTSDSPNRYGSGFGPDQNTWVKGLTSTPMAYWSDTPLRLTAIGGSFVSGQIEIALHYMEITPPDPV